MKKKNDEEFIGKSELDSKKVLGRHSRLYGNNYYCQKEVENIIEDIAKENNKKKNEIKNIVLIQFRVFKDMLVEGSPPTKEETPDLNNAKIVRMMHFGMFCPYNEIRKNNPEIFDK